MKPLNKTAISLGIAIACMVVSGGVYVFFFFAMKNKTENALTLSAQLNQLSGAQLRYIVAGSALQNEQPSIEKLSTYFIRESEIVSFTKKIEALGPEAGVTLSLESLDPGMVAKVPVLDFRILAEGKFENVERVLLLLQNFPGKFEWKAVRLTHEGDASPGTTVSKWKVEATLTAYNFIKG